MTETHPKNGYPPISALLVTVGGAPASAVHTLNELEPRFICFFVSSDTRPSIREKIIPALTYTPEHYDWIETQSPQNLLECYRILYTRLPPILEKWGIPATELGVEYTGGTKPMSVAAVLSTIDSSSRYYYVGATDPKGRDRDGIGVVLDGRESTWYQINPWEALSINLRREIAFLFNLGRFSDAQERAERLAHLVPPDMQPIYHALAQLIEGYAQWDRFAYVQAQQIIGKAMRILQPYAAGREDFIRLSLVEIDKNLSFLGALNQKNSEESRRLDVLDLLANADRRAKSDGRYDDAVARLYSALEELARNRLIFFNIKASAARPDQIPERIRSSFIQKYGDQEKENTPLRIGLEGCYLLLAELGDPLGLKYLSQRETVTQVLNARNQSRLAHGTTPVQPETYNKLQAILYDFAQIKPEDLPTFPTLRL